MFLNPDFRLEIVQQDANVRSTTLCDDIMTSPITTSEFIKRSREIHGKRYDYGNVVYKTSKKKVAIICREHGVFHQIPNSHLNGRGCIRCAGKKKKTTSEFVSDCINVHGDRYDYSKTNYVGARKKLIVTCVEHGDFEILASTHLRGANCPDCVNQYQRLGKKISWTTDSWISKSRELHGDSYIYSETNYVDAKTKVRILCPSHGLFQVLPRHHIGRRIGCPTCGGTEKMTTESFISASKVVHGEMFDYSQTRYENAKSKVKLICPIHGEFQITPSDHLYGQKSGCQSCSGNRPLTEIEWIEKANDIHDSAYDYEHGQDWGTTRYITVNCRTHGPWRVLVSNHIYRESGCPICSPKGYNQNLPGYYYVNAIKNLNGDVIFYKGGISNNYLNRLKELESGLPEGMSIINLESIYFQDGKAAMELEKQLLSIDEIRAPKREFNGGTELFLKNPLEFLRSISNSNLNM